METKKVKKKRFNILKFLVIMLFLYIIVAAFLKLYKSPIKNIIVLNNNYLSDEEIIESAKLEKYPSFIKTSNSAICKRIKKIKLVDDCGVRKKFGYVIEINIEENKILYKMRSNNTYILSNGKSINFEKEYKGVPVLINYVPDDKLDKLNAKLAKLSNDVLIKISEIEYSPTTYDEDRFILYMADTNMVYITLTKMERLNKYNDIKCELEGHKGVLYLDSGNYFEIKD